MVTENNQPYLATDIISRGYNVGWTANNGETTGTCEGIYENPKAVERALLVKY
jgi:hypothetical protein